MEYPNDVRLLFIVCRGTLQILLTHTDLFKSRENLSIGEEPEELVIDLRQVDYYKLDFILPTGYILFHCSLCTMPMA